MGGEEMGRLTVSGPRGADRGDEPRGALWKCHCYFDSWTVFKKRRCWPFPPLCQDKELGRQWGEPGLGSAPRGMFWLNKQLWTMSTFCPPWHSRIPPPRLYKVWKFSWTASETGTFKICTTGSGKSQWKPAEKSSKFQTFLMSWKKESQNFARVKFNLTLIPMAWQASGLRETLVLARICSKNSYKTEKICGEENGANQI